MKQRLNRLFGRLTQDRCHKSGQTHSLVTKLKDDNNPLAALQHPCPPTPKWDNIRRSVLLRAEAFAKEDENSNKTAIVERLQFATAIALFVVIACCIIGLLVPLPTSSGDVMLAGSHRDGCSVSAPEPTLAYFQHP